MEMRCTLLHYLPMQPSQPPSRTLWLDIASMGKAAVTSPLKARLQGAGRCTLAACSFTIRTSNKP